MHSFRCPFCKNKVVTEDQAKGQPGECPFCKKVVVAPVLPSRTARFVVEMRERVDRRKAIILGALLGILLLVAGITFLGGDDSPSLPPDERCRRQMMTMLDNSVAIPGGMPKSTGSQFWIDVAQKQKVEALLKCPAETVKGRTCDYRGPAKTVTNLIDNNFIMMCMTGNHPGGVNVLLRSGGVSWVPEGTDQYKRALAETKE